MATLEITANGQKVGTLRGYEKTVTPGGALSLKNIGAQSGKVTLRFAITGKDKRSTAYGVGLDAFVMQPRRSYIPAWLLAGPFPNPVDGRGNRLGLDSVYPPELDPDPAKTFTRRQRPDRSWRKVITPEKGRVDLYMFDPYELVVVYARTYIVSSKDQTLPLLLGSDDGVKVFLNGKEIHRVLKVRIARPDMDTVPLNLKKGSNTLLLKIENNFGGYNFYARIRDPGHTLGYDLPVLK